jgi:hypothetical protein
MDTIVMIRSEPQHPGGPTRADVHPDEVPNWLAAGWVLAAQADEAGGEQGEEADTSKPLEKMTVRELRAFARGKIVIPADAVTKEAILTVISAALAGEDAAGQV